MTDTNQTPRNRADIRGEVAKHIADCVDTMRGELDNSADFIFAAEDTRAWSEYRDTLTETEMRAAFRSAGKSRPVGRRIRAWLNEPGVA